MPTLPSDIRIAVASQPTVEQSVEALTRAIVNRINQPVTDAGPDSARALAMDFRNDPKSWSDAVLANTPQAMESAAIGVPSPIKSDAGEGDIKADVEAQPSISQAVVAFIRHAAEKMLAHAEGDEGAAKDLVDSITEDGGQWSDAILKNTVATPTRQTLGPVASSVRREMMMPGTGADDPNAPQPDAPATVPVASRAAHGEPMTRREREEREERVAGDTEQDDPNAPIQFERAADAVQSGSMAQQAEPAESEPSGLTQHAPNAPPHGEQQAAQDDEPTYEQWQAQRRRDREQQAPNTTAGESV